MTINLTGWSASLRHVVIGFAATGAGLLMSAAAGAQSPAQNRATVLASFDAWRAGTGSPFELLSEDVSWTIEGNSTASKTYPSKSAFMGEVIGPFNARMMTGIKPDVRSITAEADRVVILFDARGTARDGFAYVNSYAWFFQMREGRVVKANAFFDAVAFNDLWSRVAPVN
ncbi:MAG: nuclear transport factor 2 family protein [Tardiphaga sp.]